MKTNPLLNYITTAASFAAPVLGLACNANPVDKAKEPPKDAVKQREVAKELSEQEEADSLSQAIAEEPTAEFWDKQLAIRAQEKEKKLSEARETIKQAISDGVFKSETDLSTLENLALELGENDFAELVEDIKDAKSKVEIDDSVIERIITVGAVSSYNGRVLTKMLSEMAENGKSQEEIAQEIKNIADLLISG